MKSHPRHILLSAVCRYLNDDERKNLLDKLNREKPRQDRKFLRILHEHFDFERMKTAPVYSDDIWVYNYLKYEAKDKLPRKGLIAKYAAKYISTEDKEIFNASIAGL